MKLRTGTNTSPYQVLSLLNCLQIRICQHEAGFRNGVHSVVYYYLYQPLVFGVSKKMCPIL